MKPDILESIFAGLLPHAGDHVSIAWQGGEPTLAGLDFFNKAILLQKQYQRAGQTVSHVLQTNGTMINDHWCDFFKQHHFLIGLSLDGPRAFHDHYRRDSQNHPSADQVLKGMRLLRKHRVPYNLLTVLNDRNVKHPDEIFNYLVNQGATYLQFIPAIEWENAPGGSPQLAHFSPHSKDYGRFLCRVFDIWFEKHRHRISVRLFDTMLNRLVIGKAGYCIFDQACSHQLTIEHDGSIYGCDHFVQPRWQVGSIQGRDAMTPLTVRTRPIDSSRMETKALQKQVQLDWLHRINPSKLEAFACRKQDLADTCRSCQWKRFCYGGCPKHRPHRGELSEPTVLCAGYQQFFEHAMPRLQWIADYLLRGYRPPI